MKKEDIQNSMKLIKKVKQVLEVKKTIIKRMDDNLNKVSHPLQEMAEFPKTFPKDNLKNPSWLKEKSKAKTSPIKRSISSTEPVKIFQSKSKTQSFTNSICLPCVTNGFELIKQCKNYEYQIKRATSIPLSYKPPFNYLRSSSSYQRRKEELGLLTEMLTRNVNKRNLTSKTEIEDMKLKVHHRSNTAVGIGNNKIIDKILIRENIVKQDKKFNKKLRHINNNADYIKEFYISQ